MPFVALVVASVLGSPIFVTDIAQHDPEEPVAQWLAAVDLHPGEYGVIHHTNEQRQQYGLAPLKVDSWLLNSARRHAAWMTTARTLTHTTANVGENIAMGQTSCPEVVQAWMNSPGHRANILNPNYQRIGVASYTTADGTIYWCQQFLE